MRKRKGSQIIIQFDGFITTTEFSSMDKEIWKALNNNSLSNVRVYGNKIVGDFV